MTATPAGGKYKLDGVKSFVLDGHTADLIVVLARRPGTEGGGWPLLLHRRGDAPGCSAGALKTMDETRKLARLTFTGVEAELLGEEGAAAVALQETLTSPRSASPTRWWAAPSGCASTLDYAKMRMQFGRAIASFQTTEEQGGRHAGRCRAGEVGGLLCRRRARRGRRRPAGAGLARQGLRRPRPIMQTAIHAVQMHGGIGFTWDNDTHLWFKRAKSSRDPVRRCQPIIAS